MANTTIAEVRAVKLRDVKTHWKFRSPTPLKIQSSGDPSNFGYTPLETDKETLVPPFADIEIPVVALTDAQGERPYREGKRSREFKNARESLIDCKETLMSTARLVMSLLESTNTSMEAEDVEDERIETVLRGKVYVPENVLCRKLSSTG